MSDEDSNPSSDEYLFDSSIIYEDDGDDWVYDEENDAMTPAAIEKLIEAVDHVSGGSTSVSKMSSVEDVLKVDANLSLLELNCGAIKVKEINYHKDIVNIAQSERGSLVLQSQKVAIEFSAATNPADGNFWLRRLYSTVTSSKFYKAVRDGDVGSALELITQELLIYIGVRQTLVVLKKYWTIVLEALEAFLKKHIKVANCGTISVGIIMICAGLMISTRDRRSWDQVPFDTVREILKVTVVLMTSF